MLRLRRGKLPLLAAAVAGAIPSFSFGQSANWTYTGNNSGNWTGSWNVNSNWSPNTAFPNSSTAAANFNATVLLTGSGGSGTVVIQNAPVSVKQMNFQPTGTNSNSFTITGSGSLASLNIANGGTIDVTGAGTTSLSVATISANIVTPATSTIYKTGTGNLVLSGNNNFGGGSGVNGLSVNGGTLVAIGANALTGLSIISTAATGVLELQGATLGTATQTVIGGVGSAIAPDQGMIHASGNNLWNGNWFGTAAGASAGVDASSTLTVNGGLFDGSDPTVNGFSKVGGTGTMVVNQMVLNGKLSVTGGTLQVKANATPNDPNGASTVGSLSISGTGKVDLTNNKLTIHYGVGNAGTVVADVRAALIAGRGGSADWTGTTGITSSSIATGPAVRRSLGYKDVPGTGDLIVMYTRAGDGNLDGVTNINDLGLISQFYLQTNKQWFQGDYNYDGVVNISDLGIVSQNYNGALPSVDLVGLSLDPSSQFLADWATVTSAVPEPGTFAVMGIGCAALLGRRRREGNAKK
jgi:hypothetical protein